MVKFKELSSTKMIIKDIQEFFEIVNQNENQFQIIYNNKSIYLDINSSLSNPKLVFMKSYENSNFTNILINKNYQLGKAIKNNLIAHLTNYFEMQIKPNSSHIIILNKHHIIPNKSMELINLSQNLINKIVFILREKSDKDLTFRLFSEIIIETLNEYKPNEITINSNKLEKLFKELTISLKYIISYYYY